MKQLIIPFTILSLLTSCAHYASTHDLESLSVGTEKPNVIRRMSGQGVARGSIINKWGQVIEVREYEVAKPADAGYYVACGILTLCTFGLFLPMFFVTPPNCISTYWLYFNDGCLVQWGKAGDWESAQHMIYDINFNANFDGAKP